MNMITHSKWRKLWQSVDATGDDQVWYQRLVSAWSEPQRHYHTLQHLEDCLNEFSVVHDHAEDAANIELALWFHDVVYDPKAPDNEERSAEVAVQCLSEAGVSVDRLNKIERLVLATKTHDSSVDVDAPLLMDIDLAILGQTSERFRQYEREIRQEYAWVPEPIFREKRAAILQMFLDRPVIFQTVSFRSRYEEQARENLFSSIRLLNTNHDH